MSHVRPPWREIALVYGATLGLSVALVRVKDLYPWLSANVHALVGLVFLFVPLWVLRSRDEDLARFGISFGGVLDRPPDVSLLGALGRAMPAAGRETLFGLALALLVFPPYWLGFRIFWNIEQPFVFGLPPDFASLAAGNLLVVAIPEEFLYRGYLQTRLDDALGAPRRVLGAAIGWALPLQAALFALGHFAADGNPQRLGVFFPALLFGWLRARRGSIGAAVILHAASNLFSDFLIQGYYGAS